MSRLAQRIEDVRVLTLIRRYLEAGMMAGVLASLTRFLWQRRKLKVNAQKSAVDQPWRRKSPGYSISWDREPKLRIAVPSIQRFARRVRERLRGARGRNLVHVIEELHPLLCGWAAYFKLAQTRQALATLDGWIRRKLRCVCGGSGSGFAPAPAT